MAKSAIRWVSRGGGFVLIPMLSLVSPLLAFPAITSRYGAEAWAAIAIGQSFGAAAAVLVELGWGLNGPQRVSRMSQSNRNRVFTLSLASKLMVAPFAVAVSGIAAYLVSPHYSLEAALTAAGATCAGLSTAWFFIGMGKPFRIFQLDALPRVLGVASSALFISFGFGLLYYPIVGLIVPSLLAPILATLHLRPRRKDWAFVRRFGPFRSIRYQWHALAARAVSASYISLPTAIVALVSPGAVAVFAAADRLQRMYLSVLSAVPNALQGWVGKPPTQMERVHRARRAIVWNAAFGLIAGLMFAVAAPAVSRIVFSGVATVPIEISVLCGTLILVVCTSRATGNLGLVAQRRIKYVTASAILGALIGLPAIWVLAGAYGVAGALWGAIAAELVVLLTQLWGLFQPRRVSSAIGFSEA